MTPKKSRPEDLMTHDELLAKVADLREKLRSQDSVIIDQTQTIREQDQSILTLEKQNQLMKELLMSLKKKSDSEEARDEH